MLPLTKFLILATLASYCSSLALHNKTSTKRADPINPTLVLEDAYGNKLTVSKHDDADMTLNLGLVAFLKLSVSACCSGIWRFYPDKDFSQNSGSGGVTLGYDDALHCFDISSGSDILAGMKSYRVLGPRSSVDDSVIDLNQQAIVLYTEKYGGGVATTYTKEDFDEAILNISGVKSFLITGEYDEDVDMPSDELAPVFKFFSIANATGADLCFALIKPEEKRAKMYLQNLDENPGNSTNPIALAAIFYFPYSAYLDARFLCPGTLHEVPLSPIQNLESFPEISVM